MSTILNRIKRGNGNLANRFVIAGPMGIGKTTLASNAPKPIFICAEDGLTGFDHIDRFQVEKLSETYELLDSLIMQGSQSPYKTVVIDTIDFLERIIAVELCKSADCATIEEYGGGYGKGFTAVEFEMCKILARLDALRSKGVSSIILAHTHTKTFTNPEGLSWDRYELKGMKKSVGLLGEWADAVLFCTYEVFKTKTKGERKEKVIGGDRIMHTTWSPAWDAKNRLNLPETLSLEWDTLEAAIKENSTESLRDQVKKLYATAKLDDKAKSAWTKRMTEIDGVSADKLKKAIENLNAKQ